MKISTSFWVLRNISKTWVKESISDVAFACEPCALGDLWERTMAPFFVGRVVSVFVMEIIALTCVESQRRNFVYQSTALPDSGV